MTKLQGIVSWNMKKYRKKCQFSQSDLAMQVKSGGSYISQIERGLRFPSPQMIERISAALDIEEYELFVPEEIGPTTSFELYHRIQHDVCIAIRDAFKN